MRKSAKVTVCFRIEREQKTSLEALAKILSEKEEWPCDPSHLVRRFIKEGIARSGEKLPPPAPALGPGMMMAAVAVEAAAGTFDAGGIETKARSPGVKKTRTKPVAGPLARRKPRPIPKKKPKAAKRKAATTSRAKRSTPRSRGGKKRAK